MAASAPWSGTASPRRSSSSTLHDTLWTGVPGKCTDPNEPYALAVVRKLVDEGKFVDATVAASSLLNGPTEVIYGIGEVQYSREHFCSNPHQVVATKISANKPGHISFTLSLNSQLDHNVRITNGNEMIMEGTCPGRRPALHHNGANDAIGIKFAAVVGLQIGGTSAKVTIIDDQKLEESVFSSWVLFFRFCFWLCKVLCKLYCHCMCICFLASSWCQSQCFINLYNFYSLKY